MPRANVKQDVAEKRMKKEIFSTSALVSSPNNKEKKLLFLGLSTR